MKGVIMKNDGISQQIKAARQSKGLTQAQLAEKCNLDIRTIQRIESGMVKPRFYTIDLINKALGTDFNVAKDTPISLSWKKKLLGSKYHIYLNKEKVGSLIDWTFSQSGAGEFRQRKYSFVTTGLFQQKTQIIDKEKGEVIGNIRYNAWMNKAKLTINNENLSWQYDDWMYKRWSIWNREGVKIRYSGSITRGDIESTIDDGILLLTGLFITNYYWKYVIVLVMLGFIIIFNGR